MTQSRLVFLSTTLTFAFVIGVSAKIYKNCELARELKHKFDVDSKQISTWVCIAKHESVFNTSAVNIGSGDHGLFQISDLYWCSKDGNRRGGACYANCASFEDDDIEDDVECIRRIFNEHKRLSGDGFNAWVVYPLYCKGNTERYIEGCFDHRDPTNPTPTSTTMAAITDEENEYEFPPLPVFPKTLLTSGMDTPALFPVQSYHHSHHRFSTLNPFKWRNHFSSPFSSSSGYGTSSLIPAFPTKSSKVSKLSTSSSLTNDLKTTESIKSLGETTRTTVIPISRFTNEAPSTSSSFLLLGTNYKFEKNQRGGFKLRLVGNE